MESALHPLPEQDSEHLQPRQRTQRGSAGRIMSDDTTPKMENQALPVPLPRPLLQLLKRHEAGLPASARGAHADLGWN